MTLLATPIAGIGSHPFDTPATTEQLLRERGRLSAADPGRELLRARAIQDNLPLARRLARRYAGRGEHLDDLAQVAALALVKAVDGYDPDRETPFIGYAVPTILGALKRHFRDTAWGLRMPRSLQQLVLEVSAATGELTQRRGHPPTPAELADHLRVGVDGILAALDAARVRFPVSLNAPHAGADSSDLIDMIGGPDPGYTSVDEHLALLPLVAALPVREQRILTLRFHNEMTQDRIAAEVGVSQMQVSRLLRRSLAQLRVELVVRAGAVSGPSGRSRVK